MKVVFLCHFSSSQIRDILVLKKSDKYNDFAIWVPEYIREFEKHPEIEFHIVSPHYGMKHMVQSFIKNGIYYHFFRPNNNVICKIIDKLTNGEKSFEFSQNRKRIKNIIGATSPDIVILCGAENPYYAIGALDIKDKPIYVILQTLLNDPKRIEMGVGSDYRRMIEKAIFKHAKYYCTSDEQSISMVSSQNPQAEFLPAGFPTIRRNISSPKIKEFDFVFFARRITKYKGIEDLLKAIAIVQQKYDTVKLNIVGDCSTDYYSILNSIIEKNHIEGNIHFSGFFKTIDDTLSEVVKAKVAVLPGITASLNSTVRESMLLGLPTICYKTPATELINIKQQCIMTAKMEDIEDLASQMIFSITEYEQTSKIAHRGKEYADNYFSNEAIVRKLIENCKYILGKEI